MALPPRAMTKVILLVPARRVRFTCSRACALAFLASGQQAGFCHWALRCDDSFDGNVDDIRRMWRTPFSAGFEIRLIYAPFPDRAAYRGICASTLVMSRGKRFESARRLFTLLRFAGK